MGTLRYRVAELVNRDAEYSERSKVVEAYLRAGSLAPVAIFEVAFL